MIFYYIKLFNFNLFPLFYVKITLKQKTVTYPWPEMSVHFLYDAAALLWPRYEIDMTSIWDHLTILNRIIIFQTILIFYAALLDVLIKKYSTTLGLTVIIDGKLFGVLASLHWCGNSSIYQI